MANPGELTAAMIGERSKFKFSHTCKLLSKYIKEKGTPTIDMKPPRSSHQSETIVPSENEPLKKQVLLPDLNTTTSEVTSSQMTLFYGGKVMVFENFTEEKVEVLVAMAREATARVPAAQSCPLPVERSTQNVPTPSADLPIARRVSLNRFLEKRKDRISSKAPYRVLDLPRGASSLASSQEKPLSNQVNDGKSWFA